MRGMNNCNTVKYSEVKNRRITDFKLEKCILKRDLEEETELAYLISSSRSLTPNAWSHLVLSLDLGIHNKPLLEDVKPAFKVTI